MTICVTMLEPGITAEDVAVLRVDDPARGDQPPESLRVGEGVAGPD